MRMRISSFMKCFAIVGMATLVSCSKDDGKGVPDVVQGAFSINGQKYNTLQDAVNAAVASGDDETVITLTASTSGDGCTVKDGHVNIDLGSFEYYLNPGKTLSFDNSIVSVTGKGGELVGEGTIIKGHDSGLSFEGNLNIDGDMDVNEMEYVGFFEDYSGVYSGNVNLNASEMHVESDKAVVNIGTLNPVLSTLFVAKAQNVTVNNVVNGKSTLPVTADVAGIVTVKEGAEVHVHTYGAGEPMTCSTPMHLIKACTACDHFIDYVDENATKVAPCEPEDLVHFAAVNATENEWGNVEYWQCSECGHFYADKEAKVSLEPQKIMIMPTLSFNLSDFPSEFVENAAATRSSIPEDGGKDDGDISLGDIVKGIAKAVEAVNAVVNFFNGNASEETLFMEKFLAMEEKINKIDKNIEKMQGQIAELESTIAKLDGAATVDERVKDLEKLERARRRFTRLCELFQPYKGKKNLTSEELAKLKEDITPVLLGWNGNSENMSRSTMTVDLANNYAKKSSLDIDGKWKAVLLPGCMWEHDTHGARQAEMRKDIATIEYSALMSACYIVFAKDYSKYTEKQKQEEIRFGLGELSDAIVAYKEGLETAYKAMAEESKYLTLRRKGKQKPEVKFEKQLAKFDIYIEMLRYNSKMFFNRDEHSKDNTAQIAREFLGINEIFDEALLMDLMTYYQTNNPTEALKRSGFDVNGKTPVAISLHKMDNHICGSGKAECRNFRWAAYTGSKFEDWLYFRGLVNTEGGKGVWWETRYLYKVNIDSSNGSLAIMPIISQTWEYEKYLKSGIYTAKVVQ